MCPSTPLAEVPHAHCALVIDDSSVERMLATAVLQKLGFSVICVASAEEALALLARRGVDLALCDIALPGMDGLTLLAALRACPAAPPCIMVSAHDDPRHAIEAMRGGARAYLVKPLRLAAMHAAIEAACPARRPQAAPACDGAPYAVPKADAGPVSRSARRMAAAIAQPVRSVAAALLQAGIRATG